MQKQNFSQGGFMPQNRQYYRKVKYPDKVTKPKCLVFVRIFLFCSVGIKIQYFPIIPFILKNFTKKMRATCKPCGSHMALIRRYHTYSIQFIKNKSSKLFVNEAGLSFYLSILFINLLNSKSDIVSFSCFNFL